MKRAYVDTPEGQIHYRTEGKGKPLLLLHRVGLSSDEYTEIIPFLAKRYQVWAMDFPGYGNSDMPPQPIKTEDYARSVIHFMDALSIKKADVVGSKLGASVAVELAAAYQERVTSIILIGCIYPLPAEKQQRLEAFRQRYMQIKEDGSHLLKNWNERALMAYATIEMRQRNLVDYLRSGLGTRAEDGHMALFSYDIESRLPLVQSPVLLLYTAEDRWLERGEAMKSLLPRGRLKTIAGAGQVPTWEKPAEFAGAILGFLENPGGK